MAERWLSWLLPSQTFPCKSHKAISACGCLWSGKRLKAAALAPVVLWYTWEVAHNSCRFVRLWKGDTVKLALRQLLINLQIIRAADQPSGIKNSKATLQSALGIHSGHEYFGLKHDQLTALSDWSKLARSGRDCCPGWWGQPRCSCPCSVVSRCIHVNANRFWMLCTYKVTYVHALHRWAEKRTIKSWQLSNKQRLFPWDKLTAPGGL